MGSTLCSRGNAASHRRTVDEKKKKKKYEEKEKNPVTADESRIDGADL